MSPWRSTLLLALAPALLAGGVQAADPFTSLHPEEAIPAPQGEVPQSPYSEFIKQVQTRLQQLGFDAGPANGYFGEKTQAALAQFQLANILPASGSLDAETLAALGVPRETQQATTGGASAGSSDQGQPAPQQPTQQPPAQQQPQEPKSEKPEG